MVTIPGKFGMLAFAGLAALGVAAGSCVSKELRGGRGLASETGLFRARDLIPGVWAFTGGDVESWDLPELADPYMTLFPGAAVISGTAQYHLEFSSVDAIWGGGPYRVIWNEFQDAQGRSAHSWDMKPVLWSRATTPSPRLWDSSLDDEPPWVVWYGGTMRSPAGSKLPRWPEDNFSRDIFAFFERSPGRWSGLEQSVFSSRKDWPRKTGDYLGHRYGHQVVMIPSASEDGRLGQVPAVFYEEVTETRTDGSPAVTKIFSDKMKDALSAQGTPVELVGPRNPATGRFYPSTVREDGAALVEGPLYFRFRHDGEEWEAIGFSAGSYYGFYPACFASRRVSDGLLGKPYQLDLRDDGADLHDAGAELRKALSLRGGPGRPAVIVRPDGQAILTPDGFLQVLFHGYRPGSPSSRVVMHAILHVSKGPSGALRFRIAARASSL